MKHNEIKALIDSHDVMREKAIANGGEVPDPVKALITETLNGSFMVVVTMPCGIYVYSGDDEVKNGEYKSIDDAMIALVKCGLRAATVLCWSRKI